MLDPGSQILGDLRPSNPSNEFYAKAKMWYEDYAWQSSRNIVGSLASKNIDCSTAIADCHSSDPRRKVQGGDGI